MQSNRFVVVVVFTNLSPDAHLKDLDLNVLDSLNTKLMREVRLSYLLCQKPRNLCISWTWTGLGGHWHLFVLVSIFNIFLFLATCARLSWSHSAFQSTLNSHKISYPYALFAANLNALHSRRHDISKSLLQDIHPSSAFTTSSHPQATLLFYPGSEQPLLSHA